MHHHIGTDIIEIHRIREAIERFGDRFLDRVYSAEELRIFNSRAHSLAAGFAGKEAVMKVLGTGNRGVAWREIEILHYRTGKPYVRLSARAKAEAEKLGIMEMDISLSHSHVYATAVAIGVTR